MLFTCTYLFETLQKIFLNVNIFSSLLQDISNEIIKVILHVPAEINHQLYQFLTTFNVNIIHTLQVLYTQPTTQAAICCQKQDGWKDLQKQQTSLIQNNDIHGYFAQKICQNCNHFHSKCISKGLLPQIGKFFTLKIICVNIFHVVKLLRFRLIREFFLTVDDCNTDKHLESSWHLVYYQVSGEPGIARCSHRSDI